MSGELSLFLSLLITRQLFGWVFLVAGATKLSSLQAFIGAVETYRLLPDVLARFMGYTLPYVELAVGLALLLGLATLEAAIIGAALLLMFLLAQILVLSRGDQVPCGCFGSSAEQTIGLQTVARTALLLLLSIIVLAGVLRCPNLPPESEFGLPLTSRVICQAAVAALFFQVLGLWQLLENRRLAQAYADYYEQAAA